DVESFYWSVGSADARHTLVDLAPLLVQVRVGRSHRPIEGLDVIDRLLVAQIGALVSVTARDAAPHPIAGRTPPRAGAAAAIERAVGGHQGALDARLRLERGDLHSPLRGLIEKVLARNRDRPKRRQ